MRVREGCRKRRDGESVMSIKFTAILVENKMDRYGTWVIRLEVPQNDKAALMELSAHTKKRLKIFLAIALSQGLIGYVQWFTDLPEILVGLHLAGSTLVWIASWRIWLSVTTKNG